MKKYRKSKRYYYYRKQRIYGVVVTLLGVLSAIVSGGDITVAWLLVPAGLYLCFTKDMVITDDYFYEMEAKELHKWRKP